MQLDNFFLLNFFRSFNFGEGMPKFDARDFFHFLNEIKKGFGTTIRKG